MADLEDVTTGELFRAFQTFQSTVDKQFDAMDDKFDMHVKLIRADIAGLDYVRRSEWTAEMRSMKADVKDLKGSRTWMSRTLGGMVATPVVGAFIWVFSQMGRFV